MLVPKEVNGEPYSAVKLGELCSIRKGSGDKLIYDGEHWANRWKLEAWAKESPAASEWVLIPKADPDPEKMRETYPADGDERHFRSKRISRPKDGREPNCKKYQSDVHEKHYSEYREAKAIEVMTAALLNDVVNGEPRMLAPGSNFNYLRCVEPNASGGRVLVGDFIAHGLRVNVDFDDLDSGLVGRSLAWKSKS